MTANRRVPMFRYLIGAVFVSILLGSCSSGGSLSGSQSKVLQSNVQRIQNPQVPQADLDLLVKGNSAFGFDFFQQIRVEQSNQFFSPLSLSTALAMTYGGARGSTAEQMARVMHFDLPQEQFHPAFNALDLQLHQGSQDKKNSRPFQLDVANSIWGQKEYPFKPEFLDLLAQNYGAGLRLADFIQDAEGARQEINNWVSEKTRERIQDLIPQGGVDDSTRLVLANAIYFKADWLYPFEANNTAERPFFLLDGSQAQVKTMSFDQPESLSYLQGDRFQAVELPYAGEEVSMWVLVPDSGELAAFESGFDLAQMERILSESQETELQLLLPKFEYTVTYELSDLLAGMGMPDAFCAGTPDFSGMDGTGNLCIDKIFHKAFVAVDEKGTEAAAASAVVMKELSMRIDEHIVVSVDRPFLFLIRHKPSGAILFIGRVLDPRP